jgi:hypothetical protein
MPRTTHADTSTCRWPTQLRVTIRLERRLQDAARTAPASCVRTGKAGSQRPSSTDVEFELRCSHRPDPVTTNAARRAKYESSWTSMAKKKQAARKGQGAPAPRISLLMKKELLGTQRHTTRIAAARENSFEFIWLGPNDQPPDVSLLSVVS